MDVALHHASTYALAWHSRSKNSGEFLLCYTVYSLCVYACWDTAPPNCNASKDATTICHPGPLCSRACPARTLWYTNWYTCVVLSDQPVCSVLYWKTEKRSYQPLMSGLWCQLLFMQTLSWRLLLVTDVALKRFVSLNNECSRSEQYAMCVAGLEARVCRHYWVLFLPVISSIGPRNHTRFSVPLAKNMHKAICSSGNVDVHKCLSVTNAISH